MLAMIIILYYYLGGSTRLSFKILYNPEILLISCVTQNKKFNISGPHALYLLNKRVQLSDL